MISCSSASVRFLSTLPARGATSLVRNTFVVPPRISIHAPREGSDGPQVQHGVADGDISIHAPREGSDTIASTTAFVLQ